MNNCCGQSYYRLQKETTDIPVETIESRSLVGYNNEYDVSIVPLYSAYLGKVSVDLMADKTKTKYEY